MKLIPANIACPACGGAMTPAVLCCRGCELEVKGTFALNEFASLSPDELHFLRIFVHTEGSIREMESALGVSYPTIKARLAKLRAALGGAAAGQAGRENAQDADGDDGVRIGSRDKARQVLKDLEAGRLSVDQAIEQIRGQDREE